MMKKLVFIWILLLGLAFAQDKPNTNAEERPPERITHFVRTEHRVSKNMVFLFDCSTSMGKTNRFQTAIREVNTILRQPLDDGMFSLLTFKATDNHVRIWPGLKHEDDPKPPPPGWAKLPDLIAVRSANQFLNRVHCNDYTDLGSGIKKAFDLNAQREKVTLIVFTDGNNTYPGFRGRRPSQVVADIKKWQKARTDRKLDKIQIFIFGVSAEQNVVMLSAIAKNNDGGYLTTDRVCRTCLRNKEDKPEVQQIHRAKHLSENHPMHDEDLQGLESDEEEAEGSSGNNGQTPPGDD